MVAYSGPLPLSLLPDASCLRLDEIVHEEDIIMMIVSVTAREAICPRCGTRSGHVHSRYCRTLRDLPCHGAAVRISLRTQRFYCRAEDCCCRIFTQRLPVVVAPYGRRTCRNRDALLAIGYALGGEAGRHLAERLGIESSADTILRMMNSTALAGSADDVKILGVDDWAWRRGHRYGTVLVDLERRQPIDLLPDRESATLTQWLRAHPAVRVISRDRAGAYAEGARQGAPQAVQVADRFHLFCNMTQALQRVLERLASVLQRVQLPEPAASSVPDDAVGPADQGVQSLESALPESSVKLARHEQERHQRREKRKALFEAVRLAYRRGLTKRAIACEIGITRTTVRRMLKAEEFPERAPRQRRSELDGFREYLEARWAEGCHNASQLCRELRQRGYGGQRSRVKEYVQPWRARSVPAASRPRRTLPNLKLVAFWLMKPPNQRAREEQFWVEAATTVHPHVATVEQLAQQFRLVFTERNPEAFKSWLARGMESEIPEMKSFATGIQRDYEAVLAAVEQPWSNGQVEGQVHRLKLIKRQMYGRGGFQLLRRRVLPFRPQCSQHSP
jgi:transposase